MSDYLHVIRATIDPNAPPTRAGQHWINTATNKQWLSNGSSLITDWQLVGSVTSWDLTGNTGTNSSTDFLGTTDLQPLSIRTDGDEAIHITVNQQVGIGTQAPLLHTELKSHVSSSASGVAESSFFLTTSSASFSNAIAVPLLNLSCMYIEYVAIARMSDGSGRAAFKRKGLFMKEGGNVQIQGNWQSDFTVKSDVNFNVSYSLTANEVILLVKSPNTDPCKWTGHIKIQALY